MPVPAIAGPLFSSAMGFMLNQATNTGTMSLKAQSLLNDKQQEYARENANTEYLKQAQLTTLNPLLQKRGMVNAGMNPSFVNGSSIGAASTVNSTAAPSAGSAPQYQGVGDLLSSGINAATQILQSAGVLSDNGVKAATVDNINADTKNKQAQLSTYYRDELAKLNQTIAETRDKNLKADLQEMQNNIFRQYGESNAYLENQITASNASIAQSDAAVRGAMNDATYDKLLAETDELSSRSDVNKSTKKNLDYTRQNVLPAQADNLRAGAKLAREQSKLCIEQTKAENLRNAINDNPTVKDAQVIQEVIKSAPTNVAQAVFSNPWYKRYIKACYTGEPLDYEVKWNFQRLCTQYSLITSGAAGTVFDTTLPTTSSVQDPRTIK